MRSKVIFFLLMLGFALSVISCEEDLLFDDPRDNLTGEWMVNEDSEEFKKKDMNRIYNVNISKDLFDSTVFYIDGFYEIDRRVKVIMEDLNLIIPEQTINGFTIQDGYGAVTSDYSEMTFYYYVSFTGIRDEVRADYTRSANN